MTQIPKQFHDKCDHSEIFWLSCALVVPFPLQIAKNTQVAHRQGLNNRPCQYTQIAIGYLHTVLWSTLFPGLFSAEEKVGGKRPWHRPVDYSF